MSFKARMSDSMRKSGLIIGQHFTLNLDHATWRMKTDLCMRHRDDGTSISASRQMHCLPLNAFNTLQSCEAIQHATVVKVLREVSPKMEVKPS